MRFCTIYNLDCPCFRDGKCDKDFEPNKPALCGRDFERVGELAFSDCDQDVVVRAYLAAKKTQELRKARGNAKQK